MNISANSVHSFRRQEKCSKPLTLNITRMAPKGGTIKSKISIDYSHMRNYKLSRLKNKR